MLLPRNESPSDSAHFAPREIGWQALGPALGTTFLATIVVAARWYTRCKIAKCNGSDDWAILVSLLLSITMTTLIGVQVHDGIGLTSTHVSPTTIAKLVIVNNNLWILLVNITKASLLLQYLRVFSDLKLRLLSCLLLLFLLPAMLWGVFGGTFLCTPTAKLWRPDIPGRCMNARTYWLSVAGIDIGLDTLILVLPIPSICRLRLPRRQKITLIAAFTLGFVVCVVSIIRVVTVMVANAEHDYIASAIWAIVWSVVEGNVGIVCASLLALKPLLVELFPSLLVEDAPPSHSTQLPAISSPVECAEVEKMAPARIRGSGVRRTHKASSSNASSARTRTEESRLSSANTVPYGGSAACSVEESARVSNGSAWHEGLEDYRKRLSVYDMLRGDGV